MDTAYSGLERILGDVRRKTGVDAYLTPRGGEETPIFVNWKGRAVTLYLGGRGESAEREAKLVGYLLSDAEETQDSSPAKLLLGDSDKAYRLLAKYGIADGECCALDICPEKRSQDALEHIERAAEPFGFALRAEDGHIAAVKFTADGQTGYEFAQFLLQSLYEEAGIRARIGLGCDVASFEEISLSYGQAVAATRMSKLFGGAGQIHSYREYLLVRLAEDLPAEKRGEYLGRFRITGAADVLKDEELFATAETFLGCDLNLSEASRALYIHRNTLSYRLDKIERLTGLDIRKFSDAVTFRVATVLARLPKP